jgi:conflict system STAND superfamily ATPase
LPLAGITLLLIIGVMVWQYQAEQRLALPTGPAWDSNWSPYPGLEAFTEQDSTVFFGRDAKIMELLERLHPVIAAQAHRLVAVVGPSGVGKSSLVRAGVVPQLRQRRGGWIVVPPVVPGDLWCRTGHPLAVTCGIAGQWSSGMIAGRDNVTAVFRFPAAHGLARAASHSSRSKNAEILVLRTAEPSTNTCRSRQAAEFRIPTSWRSVSAAR